MKPVFIFAYGSNLDEAQMQARCASAQMECRAVLPHHGLVFGGFSQRWGGAVANAVPEQGGQVEGVLYRIEAADLRCLDRHEGHPFAYERVQMEVVDRSGARRPAHVYVQPGEGFEACSPPAGYLRVLWLAYQRLGFDVRALVVAAGLVG